MAGDFDYVYLDTEVMRKAQWPKRSVELQIFLHLVQLLHVKVCICDGVNIERRRQWVDETQRSVNDALKTLNNVSRAFPHLLTTARRLDLFVCPDAERLAQAYDELTEDLHERWNIHTIPLAQRDSHLLFDLAVNKKAAFQESGKGFQDTLIYLSAVDHLQGIGKGRGVFVSNDPIFQSAEIQALARAANVEMETLKTISSVAKRLRAMLEEDPKRRWEFDLRAAEQSLENYEPVLQRFVADELLPVTKLVEPQEYGTLKEVEIVRITNVQTPDGGRAVDQIVPLSFDLLVRVRLMVYGNDGRKEKLFEIDIKVEADAKWNGDYYEEIKPSGTLSSQVTTIVQELGKTGTLSANISCNELELRAEGYSELLGEIQIQLAGVIPRTGVIHVDIVVSLDTFLSSRIDGSGFLEVTLTSSHRGDLVRGRRRNTNAVVFEAIELGSGGAPIEEILTINGIRGDASTTGVAQLSQVSSISAGVEIIAADPFLPREAIVREKLKVGTVRLGLKPGVELAGSSLLPTEGIECRRHSFVVSFEPKFPGAFKTKTQEGGDDARSATCGTICAATFAGVPSGFRVFSTLHEIQSTEHHPLATAVVTDIAGLPQTPVSGIATVDWSGAPMIEGPPRRAAWEIIDDMIRFAKSALRFGVVLVGPADYGQFEITVQNGFGPSYAASLDVRTASDHRPIPRFQNLNAPVTLKF